MLDLNSFFGPSHSVSELMDLALFPLGLLHSRSEREVSDELR